jgi:hypothetical protein
MLSRSTKGTETTGRSAIRVRFSAISVEPSRADGAEIVPTEKRMIVHPDRERDGRARQPDERSHDATFRSNSARFITIVTGVKYQDSSYVPAWAKYVSRRVMGLTPPRL